MAPDIVKGQAGAQVLRGRIRNLRKQRCRRDLVFTADDRSKMGATAIAAGLAGLGAVAAGLGAMAMDIAEEADLLEFDLDGKAVNAWVWISVFAEGDEVEVVAEPDGDGWFAYGIVSLTESSPCIRTVAEEGLRTTVPLQVGGSK